MLIANMFLKSSALIKSLIYRIIFRIILI